MKKIIKRIAAAVLVFCLALSGAYSVLAETAGTSGISGNAAESTASSADTQADESVSDGETGTDASSENPSPDQQDAANPAAGHGETPEAAGTASGDEGQESPASVPDRSDAAAGEADGADGNELAESATVTMYRLYNPNSGEHFFTHNTGERDGLVNVGWRYEGVGWIGPVKSGTPVYRLYNKNGGEHHYTLDSSERDNLVRVGWNYEGIGWYSDDAKTVPLYRVYNPNAFSNNHHYTTDYKERNHLISLGWHNEGIGWYAVSGASGTSGDDNFDTAQPTWIWYSAMPTSLPETGDVWGAFRRTFTLDTVPDTAQAEIAAENRYWLYVNGTLAVFDGSLKRGETTGSVYVDTVDIAPYLREGENTVAVLVWYWQPKAASFSNRTAGAAGLWFDAEIGSVRVASNASWKAVRDTGYKRAEEMAGSQPNYRLPESNIFYDARDEIGEWTDPSFDDSAWTEAASRGERGSDPWGAFVSRTIPLFSFSDLQDYTNSAEYTGKTYETGTTLDLVLPENEQITPYLEVKAPAGETIGIETDRYQSGGENTLRTTYVTKAGAQRFESLSWVNGKHVYYTIPAGVTVTALKYRRSGYPTEITGNFISDDDWLNTLWKRSVDTVYLCMRDTYMDCPDRERAQWWGDAAIEMLVAQYSMDSRANALFEKAIRTKAGWDTENKLYTIVPWTGNVGNEIGVQELAGYQSIWEYYLYTGSTDALNRMYAPLKNYLGNWSFDGTGLVTHYKNYFDWTDWGGNIDEAAADNAWYYTALGSMEKMADALGKAADASHFRALMTKMKTAYRARFWDGKGYRTPGLGFYDERANALAVLSGLADTSQYAAIRSTILASQNASPYMEHYVTNALFSMGYAEDAVARMKTRYAAMMEGSDGTLWEFFDASGSRNHGWSAGPAISLSRDVAGIRPTAPGYAAYEVKPVPAGLGNISCAVPSVIGEIRLAYSADPEGKACAMTVTAPAGGTACIAVPKLENTAPTISVNGTVVMQDGESTGSLAGISYTAEDSSYVCFTAGEGRWEITMS